MWVDKGMELERKDNWPNESSWNLPTLKRKLFKKIGRNEDAFESAWSAFTEHPSEYAYDEMMKYVSKKNREYWHRKAIEEVKSASLLSIIGGYARR